MPGVLAEAIFGVPAALAGVPAHALADRSATTSPLIMVGGAEWVDPNPHCHSIAKKTGEPCKVKPVTDRDHCVGHLRALEAQARRDS